EAEYFVTMSDTSLPLRSVQSLWADIAGDRRTHLDIWYRILATIKTGGRKVMYPKHGQFAAFSREDVHKYADADLDALLPPDDPPSGTRDDEIKHVRLPGFATFDEFFVGRVLLTEREWER